MRKWLVTMHHYGDMSGVKFSLAFTGVYRVDVIYAAETLANKLGCVVDYIEEQK